MISPVVVSTRSEWKVESRFEYFCLNEKGVGWLIEGLESGVDWDSIRSLRMGALTQVVGQGDQYQMGETRVARDDEGHTVVSSMEFETSLFLEGATVKAD
ncbi:hypothetical protein Tco_0722993 [Tanacetum coccineum]